MTGIILLGSISTAQVVIIGLALVFALLLLITGILFLLPLVIGLFTGKNKAAPAAESVSVPEEPETKADDGELVAVIAAAIAQAEADSAKTGRKSSFRVVSFKRVGKH